MRCPNIQCIKLLKNFVSFRSKTNCDSNQQEFSKQSETTHNSIDQNIQPNPKKFPLNRKKFSITQYNRYI